MDKSFVAPILFGVQETDLRDNPLVQFQMTNFDRSEIKKLVHSINRSSPDEARDETAINTLFDTLWPKLEEGVRTVNATQRSMQPAAQPVNGDKVSDAMEETVVNTRNILKRLSALEQSKTVGEHLIHRLERDALDRALKQSQDIHESLSELARDFAQDISEDEIPTTSLANLKPAVDRVQAMSLQHSKHVFRLRKRILQIPEDD